MAGRMLLTVVVVALVPALSGCVHDDNAWAYKATGIAALRERGLTGQGVRVAILDTGIDLDAPSLRHLDDGNVFNGEVVDYVDFVGDDGGPRDDDGHGTFVAGVLAGGPSDGLGRLRPGAVVPGGAPHVDLLVGRVSQGEVGSIRALTEGLKWALDGQADVVSMSLGIRPDALAGQDDVLTRFQQQLARAERDGVLVVAAAGNGGPVLFPANQPTVLSVGAADRDGRPLHVLVGGDRPDLYAPGRAITGPDVGDGLVEMDGTSAAVPFVAAAAALVLSDKLDPYNAPTLGQLREALRSGTMAGADGTPLLRADLAFDLYAPTLAA